MPKSGKEGAQGFQRVCNREHFEVFLVPVADPAGKARIELPPRRELNFRGVGVPKNLQFVRFFQQRRRVQAQKAPWARLLEILGVEGASNKPRGAFDVGA